MATQTNRTSPPVSPGSGPGLAAWTERRNLEPTLAKVQPFTMVPRESLVELARLVQAVLMADVPGDFVECGVWRGGASFLMADLLRQAGVRDRKVWLFDSFEGLPPPEEIDGPAAMTYAEHKAEPGNFDNCRAGLKEVQRAAAELGLAPYTRFVKGWFDQTLPTNRERIGPIAVLRIDGDWYSSVRCCLDNLYDQVAEDGFVILDDYYTYDGCAVAVHEFLGTRRLPHRLEAVAGKDEEGVESYQSALFCKGETTWKWRQQLYLTAEDVRAVVPPEETLLLADEGKLDGMTIAGRRVLPFPERDGEYWGAPADDADAIEELERQRRSGAGFLAFAWPAFWWLDYYAEFHRQLSSTSRCVLRTDRLVVFDLRP
jgi:O-methyltransferase